MSQGRQTLAWPLGLLRAKGEHAFNPEQELSLAYLFNIQVEFSWTQTFSDGQTPPSLDKINKLECKVDRIRLRSGTSIPKEFHLILYAYNRRQTGIVQLHNCYWKGSRIISHYFSFETTYQERGILRFFPVGVNPWPAEEHVQHG